MASSIADTYSELWHYTTAAGLEGILKSQQLWATNIRYLNDDEELRGFFEHKLPDLLKSGIDDGIHKICGLPRYQEMLAFAEDHDSIKYTFIEGLHDSLTAVTLKLEVFITSFCYTLPEFLEDGLLSQWRGYGHDGGYALVLDSKALNDLIVREQEQYKYSFVSFSDVDYHAKDWVNDTNRHEETLEWERKVREIVSRVVVEGDLEKQGEELFEPIIALAIRHKHRGFKEEREIRIATVRRPNKIASQREGEIPKKAVYFYNRSGVLVPYISLFDGISSKEHRLPIKEIIVGPHPEKMKRQQAIQMLLNELEIEAEVRVSDIPFLGR